MGIEAGFRVRLGIVAILWCAGVVSLTHASVVNYDNHPDLEKAKEYDLTVENIRFHRADGSFDWDLYRSYQAKASRERAEKHYLAYLQDVNDSFQRAAVYARLGEIFCGMADPRVAPTIDRDKARLYFRKALEAEPERIGMATLNARGFLATDADTDEQRFASYMDYYQWLLSIDEKKLQEKWLPTRPPRKTVPLQPEDEMRKKRREQLGLFRAQSPPRPPVSGGGFLGLIQGQADTTAFNLVQEAMGRMAVDPQTHRRSQARAVRHLLILAERFPGTSVAERAKTELGRIASTTAAGRFLVP